MVIGSSLPGQGDRPAGTPGNKACSKVRIATLNVGSLTGRSNEIVEMLSRRKIDICCLQETRWRGGSARLISGKDCQYKLFWSGSESGIHGVGVFVSQQLVDRVLSVTRLDCRIMSIRVLWGQVIFNIISAYAPQQGCTEPEKDTFFENLLGTVSKVPECEFLVIGSDLNGHVGESGSDYAGFHGGCGYGQRNNEGLRILDMCAAGNLAISNTFFKKPSNKLVTYQSGDNASQIDFILVRSSYLKYVKNSTVINSEECITQHRLLLSDLIVTSIPSKPRRYPPKVKIWKLKEEKVQTDFKTLISEACLNIQCEKSVDDLWTDVKTCLIDAAASVCGKTKGGWY